MQNKTLSMRRGPRISRRNRRRRRRVAAAVGVFGLALALLFVLKSGAPSSREEPTSNYILPTSPPFSIAMDAGHGGDDVGAVAAVQEVTLTETTVYYLNGWLKSDENYTPIYCRPDGEGATLAERAKVATQAKADLLLSIHGNSSTVPEAFGFECFPTPPGRALNEPSLRFATLISERMQTAGHSLRGNGGVRYAYYEKSGMSEDENEYEKVIVEQSDVMVRTAETFGILERAKCPAVLVEQCFLTHAPDSDAWATPEGCAKAARVYYEAICAYFGTQPLPAV